MSEIVQDAPDGQGAPDAVNEPTAGGPAADAPSEPIDLDGYGRSGLPGERAEIGKPYLKPVRLLVLGALIALLALRGLPIMVVVAAVLVMIFFHELGHFVMARRAGMKVTEFMIGFGPRIFSFRRGEVEYGLKAIPAGAYVKIIGMANIEEVPAVDEARTYRQKGYWARMGVAVAGSTMHFMMAFVLITLSFVLVGRTDSSNWVVDTIAPESAAANAGVRLGDRVLSMDGVDVSSHEEMAAEAKKRPGRSIPVEVLRDGKTVELTATITPRFTVFGTIQQDLQIYGNAEGGVSVSLPEGTKLVRSGLEDGDTIRSISGTEVTSVAQAKKLLKAPAVADTGDVVFEVTHQGTESTKTVRLDLGTSLATDATLGFFGVGQDIVPEKLSVTEAVPAAFGWFGETTVASVKGIGSFFSPSSLSAFAERTFSTAPGETHDTSSAQSVADATAAAQERDGQRIVSIVGAVVLGEQLTASGWGQLLAFLAFLNMAIGILNLIPLPPFDGGHVAIGTYEKIRELLKGDGKRYFADYNKVMPVAIAVVSFMLIVGLMAMYLDLADPVRV